jgi:2-oxoglutarate ferredoxin oxidoreductase subunit alpha
MDLAWRCQVPAFILTDKTLSEGTYSLNPTSPENTGDLPLWDRVNPYQRYADTPSGVTHLAYPGTPGAIVKVNSYAHEESGITTEEAPVVARMAEKRKRKGLTLLAEVSRFSPVDISGIPDSPDAILCWGSTKGVCSEVGEMLGLRVVRPLVLAPFPEPALKAALAGVTRIIAVEENATAQLADLASCHGIPVRHTILRYDGRQFTPEGLAGKIREVLT